MKEKGKRPVTKGAAKVPVVMQMEALECGAASLAMVLAYYGKWITLEQARLSCGVSRDGSNAGNILKAAEHYGLLARGYRFEPETLKKEGTFPCIIHWNFNHFVVLNGFKGNRAYLNDPARGALSVSMGEFDEAFTGICLLFSPGGDFFPSGKKKSMVEYAAKRLKGSGAAVAFVAMTSVIVSLMGIIYPAFSRIFLDRLLTGQNLEWTGLFFAAFAAMGVVQLIAAGIHAAYSLRISGKMAVVGNASYMWKVLRLPMEFFSQRMAGDIRQRQGAHAKIAENLVNTVAPLALHAVMMIFYFAVMLRYHAGLALIGASSALLSLMAGNIVSRKRINLTRVQMRDAGKLEGTTVAGIEMIETIKAGGAENVFFERWSGYQASVYTQQAKFEKLNQYLGVVPALVSSLADTLVFALGAFLAMQGEFTAGMVLAFQGFLGAFMAPAGNLIDAGQTLQELRVQMERIEDVMEYPTDSRCGEEESSADPGLSSQKGDHSETIEKEYSKLSGSVEMKHITFGYSRQAEPLIKDFSLKLKPGSHAAIVGPSGCGKSTVAKLISGLYKPWEGEILFDGRKIGEIDRNNFTGSLAVVDQDITLFEDTIANNIKMWDRSIEHYEMILAARDAQLHADIMRRDGGYHYRLAEGGRDLSGGQRQRMEIARVLAQDPTIIILDEATSALDARTEADVVESIRNRGITCIVVAHRLSTVRGCDEIIVMDKGAVAERGTHSELMEMGGAYARLVANE